MKYLQNKQFSIIMEFVQCFSWREYIQEIPIYNFIFSYLSSMQYTKYLATVATLSLFSVSTLVSAATGDISTGSTSTDTVVVPMTTTTSLEVKGAPRLVKKTTDSVILEWDVVTDATAYIVKYSKTSVATSIDPNAQHDNETDPVTTTGAVITKLSSTNEKLAPATSYYFSLVAIDKDGKESDTFSDELMVTTDATEMTVTAPVATLAINEVVVSDDRTLSLSFNSDLSVDPVSVKITKTSDNSDISVATVVQNPENPAAVTITTATPLNPSSSYTLTVLSAKDSAGNTIQEGVNGLKEFTTTDTLQSSVSVEMPTLYAAGTPSDETLSGTLSPETATQVATGAKENLIVLAALILSLGIVYIYRRKLI